MLRRQPHVTLLQISLSRVYLLSNIRYPYPGPTYRQPYSSFNYANPNKLNLALALVTRISKLISPPFLSQVDSFSQVVSLSEVVSFIPSGFPFPSSFLCPGSFT